MGNGIWQRLWESTEGDTVTVRIPRALAEDLLSALSAAVDSEGDEDGDIELDMGPPDGDADDGDDDDGGFGGLLVGAGPDDDDDEDEDDDDKKDGKPFGESRRRGSRHRR